MSCSAFSNRCSGKVIDEVLKGKCVDLELSPGCRWIFIDENNLVQNVTIQLTLRLWKKKCGAPLPAAIAATAAAAANPCGCYASVILPPETRVGNAFSCENVSP
jgi:hypothetical protein